MNLHFKEKEASLIFNEYKICKIRDVKEAPESSFESGDSDFEFLKLKEKVNTLQKDLSKAVNMKKEDWKRKEILVEL